MRKKMLLQKRLILFASRLLLAMVLLVKASRVEF
jgi:hypothetical protein